MSLPINSRPLPAFLLTVFCLAIQCTSIRAEFVLQHTFDVGDAANDVHVAGDGDDIYVGSGRANIVLQYDRSTGEFVRILPVPRRSNGGGLGAAVATEKENDPVVGFVKKPKAMPLRLIVTEGSSY